MQGNYGAPTITLKSGKGLVVTDTTGKKYLDFLGGIATNVLGHAHPVIVRAVSKQIATLVMSVIFIAIHLELRLPQSCRNLLEITPRAFSSAIPGLRLMKPR